MEKIDRDKYIIWSGPHVLDKIDEIIDYLEEKETTKFDKYELEYLQMTTEAYCYGYLNPDDYNDKIHKTIQEKIIKQLKN